MASRTFGQYIRRRRLELQEESKEFSLRKVAHAMEVEPSFLSKVERGVAPPPSEAKIKVLAKVLAEDTDHLLALAGKISSDLHLAIRKRPQAFAQLIRSLKNAPEEDLKGIAKESRAKYSTRP
jgi:HTH-type transcriptional regulator, competence development regulator